jgi:hypothetical protein
MRLAPHSVPDEGDDESMEVDDFDELQKALTDDEHGGEASGKHLCSSHRE